jgi:hypothetical protein
VGIDRDASPQKAEVPTSPFQFADEPVYDQNILQSIIDSKEEFTDMVFAPCLNSLVGEHKSKCQCRMQNLKSLKWRRLGNMFDHVKLFDAGRVKQENIRQGDMSNCYFIAALCSLTTKPGLIESLFITREINEAGIYAMRFYVNGKPKTVVVDDYIPVVNDGSPAFSRSKVPGEIWMCLLEKGWAKLHGSYSAIESGQAELVFQHLTNMPTQLFLHRGED